MGSGTWSASTYASYSTSKGLKVNRDGTLDGSYKAQDLYKARYMDPMLDPKGVIRECKDTEEHPNTIPVILALDVTGSMGTTLEKVATTLNKVMTLLYERVTDVEFMIMGIGDLAYDDSPIQASQFESDIRIAEQLDKLYFERGGGGNSYESYTAAWYFGLHNTDLDCWKRGKKGIIITLGDEVLNPYLPKRQLNNALGSHEQSDVETDKLLEMAKEKFDIYHLAVNDPGDSYRLYEKSIKNAWGYYLEDRFFVVTLDELAQKIVDVVSTNTSAPQFENDGIRW